MSIVVKPNGVYFSNTGQKFTISDWFGRSDGQAIFVSDQDYLFFEDGSCLYSPYNDADSVILESTTKEESMCRTTNTNTKRILNQPYVTAVSAFNALRVWGEAIFGPTTPVRIIERAGEEFDELKEIVAKEGWSPKTLEEVADVVVILMRAPGLWSAIVKKMNTNFDRKWNLRGDGTGYHIPENANQ